MSLTAAFASSRAGLAAVGVRADAAAANIANVDDPAFARRAVRTTTGAGGAPTAAIVTERDAAVEGLHRIEIARVGRQEAISSGLSAYVTGLGQPDDPSGLVSRLSGLEAAFSRVGRAPESVAAQDAAVAAAEGVARAVTDAAAGLARASAATSARIQGSVALLNDGLQRLAELAPLRGDATLRPAARAAIGDETAAILDRLADVADLRASRAPDGGLALRTSGGTAVLEGAEAARFSYDAATGRLAVETAAGAVDVTPGVPGARGFSEGRLAGEIALVRQEIPRMSAELDELARGLAMGTDAADATLGPGVAGIFADAGGPVSSASAPGLAARIEVNSEIRDGGAWRVRDGVGAAQPGPVGDGAQAFAFAAALEAKRSFSAVGGLPQAASVGGFAAALVSGHHGARNGAGERAAALAVGALALEGARADANAVDLDAELQGLTRIEQTYRANGEVIQALSRMLDSLLAAV